MTEKQLENLKTKLKNLTESEQLEIAKLLSDELYANNQSQGQNTKYDTKLADHIIYILEMYISTTKNKQKVNKLLELIEKFKNLPKEKQQRVASAAFSEIKRIEKETIQKQADEMCKKHGHIYKGKDKGWIDRSVTRVEKVDYDHQIFVAPVKHVIWERTCTRCGKKEILRDKEPEVVTKAKEEAQRQERIKKLKKELDELTRKK